MGATLRNYLLLPFLVGVGFSLGCAVGYAIYDTAKVRGCEWVRRALVGARHRWWCDGAHPPRLFSGHLNHGQCGGAMELRCAGSRPQLCAVLLLRAISCNPWPVRRVHL